MSVAGVVLAAGLSERMQDGTKQLLAFGDMTMTGLVVKTAETSMLDPVVVVIGHEADEVEATMAPQRARFARNPHYRTGNMSSFHAGVAAVGDAEAVMLLVADQPEMGRYDNRRPRIRMCSIRDPFAAVATYEGVVGHPWVLSAAAVSAAASLGGTKALWQWLTDIHAEELVSVPMQRGKPRDVNTVEDYHRAPSGSGPLGADGPIGTVDAGPRRRNP